MQFFRGRILIGMPPVAMETVFRLLNYPNYHTFMVFGILPNLLEELWSNEMELGQNGHFRDFGQILAILANTGRWQIILLGIQHVKVRRCKI